MDIKQSFTENSISKVVESKYPWIGIYRNDPYGVYIVLFTSKNTGLYLGGNSRKQVGYRSDDWSESYYRPFNGTITYEQNGVG